MKIDFFYNSKIFSFFSFFSNLLLLNICWIALCLPVVTAGASTAALYGCMILLRKGELHHVFRSFWNVFRSNFRQGTLLFLIQLLVLGLTALDVVVLLFIPGALDSWLTVLLILPFALMMPSLCYIFPLQAKFENGALATAFNAWKLSLIHLGTSILLLALHLFPAAACFFWPEHIMIVVMLWTAFGGSVIAWLSTALLDQVFRQYQNS